MQNMPCGCGVAPVAAKEGPEESGPFLSYFRFNRSRCASPLRLVQPSAGPAPFPAPRLNRKRTAPTIRRQNINTKPAIAANADAKGIKASGPI